MRSCISYNWNKTTKTKTKKSNKTLTLKKRGCLDTTVEINCDIKAFFRWGGMISWRLRLRVSPPRKNPEKEHHLKSVPLIATRSPARLRGGGRGRGGEGSERRSFCLFLPNSKTITNYRSDIILLTWYQVKQQRSQNYDKYRETLRQRYEDIQRNAMVP